MKRAFVLLLLVAAFLAGYQLGRRPDSPDVFAYVRKSPDWVAEVAETIKRQPPLSGETPDAALQQDAEPGRIAVRIGDKVYYVGNAADALATRR